MFRIVFVETRLNDATSEIEAVWHDGCAEDTAG